MIKRSIPQGIQRLACFADMLDYGFYATVDELDQIVEGKQFENDERFRDGFYLEHVLPAINWWVEVNKSLLWESGIERDVVLEPALEEERSRILGLLNNVLASYTAALEEGPFYAPLEIIRTPAGMELLKRYRLFTRAVGAFAKQLWPKFDWQWLLEKA